MFEEPEAQVQMIEETFRVVQQEEWVGKPHPRKRGITCVDSWEFLPDRGRVAQEFLLVRIQDDHISNTDVPTPTGFSHSVLSLCRWSCVNGLE